MTKIWRSPVKDFFSSYAIYLKCRTFAPHLIRTIEISLADIYLLLTNHFFTGFVRSACASLIFFAE